MRSFTVTPTDIEEQFEINAILNEQDHKFILFCPGWTIDKLTSALRGARYCPYAKNINNVIPLTELFAPVIVFCLMYPYLTDDECKMFYKSMAETEYVTVPGSLKDTFGTSPIHYKEFLRGCLWYGYNPITFQKNGEGVLDLLPLESGTPALLKEICRLLKGITVPQLTDILSSMHSNEGSLYQFLVGAHYGD